MDFAITLSTTIGSLLAIFLLWVDAANCFSYRKGYRFASYWAVVYFLAGLSILVMLWRY